MQILTPNHTVVYLSHLVSCGVCFALTKFLNSVYILIHLDPSDLGSTFWAAFACVCTQVIRQHFSGMIELESFFYQAVIVVGLWFNQTTMRIHNPINHITENTESTICLGCKSTRDNMIMRGYLYIHFYNDEQLRVNCGSFIFLIVFHINYNVGVTLCD